MSPNWFIACPVPSFEGFETLFQQVPQNLRPFQVEDLHITLAFFGNIAIVDALKAWEVAKQIKFPAFEVSFDAIKAFGPSSRPSAFSIVLDTGRIEAESLILNHRAALHEAAGVPADARPPKPHITIARPSRKATDADLHEMTTWATGLSLPKVHIEIQKLALYTWARDRHARQFEVVAATHLSEPVSSL